MKMMSMRQIIKRFLWIAGLATLAPSLFAFSLEGPVGNGGDDWQAQANGFNPVVWGIPYGFTTAQTDGPKNLGEEYRCNAPVMYYACDANFLEFFGMSGMNAVEQAFTALNVLTNVDSYSPGLLEFPLQSEAINYTAQTWGLYDLKSLTLALVMEQIGLTDAIRYTWVIHDRFQPTGTTCQTGGTEYLVTSRNFDLFSLMPDGSPSFYSPYVNSTLYTYRIWEYCGVVPPSPLTAAAVAQNTDPSEEYQNAPVASGLGISAAFTVGGAWGSLLTGGYYTGLTRDDMQGLRYLYTTNNINYESSAPGSVLLSSTSGGGTGLGAPYALYSSNYTAFSAAALTNDPAILASQYPGLVVLTSTNYFVVVSTPNIVAYFTNNLVLGNPPVLVVKTNGYTSTVMLNYSNTYANLIVSNSSPNTSAQLVTLKVSPGGVLGNPFVTNISTKSVLLTNLPSGDFYINTNYLCGPIVILGTLLTNVTATTNLIFATSNSAGYFTAQSIVYYSTTHVYLAQSPLCGVVTTGAVANATGLYQGVGRLQFVQHNYDSLIGQFWEPVTNVYTMVFVTNSQPFRQTFQRVVTAPDFLFSAADLTAGPGQNPIVPIDAHSVPGFSTDPGYSGLAGPGTINPGGRIITYNKVGPVYYNQSFSYLQGTNNQFAYAAYFLYGSFDGTTNRPIVYPDATSIAKLEAAELIQITPSSPGGLPAGRSNVVYNATISALGGQSPYAWTLTVGQLPDGLSLSTASATNCVISGTPTRGGTYFFTIQMTDANTSVNTMNMDYSITINN
jgi:hypothetical protein